MQLLSMAPFLRTGPHVKAESVNLSCIRGLVRKNGDAEANDKSWTGS
jgi:hypothetical protein